MTLFCLSLHIFVTDVLALPTPTLSSLSYTCKPRNKPQGPTQVSLCVFSKPCMVQPLTRNQKSLSGLSLDPKFKN